MLHAQEVSSIKNLDGSSRRMSDEEMITTWHGGQGYLVAVNEKDGETVRNEAVRLGIDAKRIGLVTKQPGIVVVSRGAFEPGKAMKF